MLDLVIEGLAKGIKEAKERGTCYINEKDGRITSIDVDTEDVLVPIETAEFILSSLGELKREYGARTERDNFYYGKGYKDGRKELVDELMSKLSEEADGGIDDEWYAGRDCGIDRAMDIVESMTGDDSND